MNTKTETARRGRPSNIAKFYALGLLSAPIKPLGYAQTDDLDWFLKVREVVFDRLHGKPMQDRTTESMWPQINSGSPNAIEMHIVQRAAEIDQTPVGNKAYIPVPHSNEDRMPNFRTGGVRFGLAKELSWALLDLTRREPYHVRHAVLCYCWAVGCRMRVVLTDRDDAKYGRTLIWLVNELNRPWLTWRLIGFHVAGEGGDPSGWIFDLGLPSGTLVEYQPARDPLNRAELGHIGIEVRVKQSVNSERNSREFFEVMLGAAIVELWRCVPALAA